MATRLAEVFVKFSGDITDLKSKMSTGERSISKFGERMGSIGSRMSMLVSAPLLALGVAATSAGVTMDSLDRGLTSVMGTSAAAAHEIKNLKEVAKLPGLGFKEAIQGSTNLQAAGFSANLARRSLLGFGNALATVGKGKTELDAVNRALTQIASKSKISAEEINQLAEHVPQIRRIMQQAFGTADTEKLQKMGIKPAEFIEKIVTELEKLPRVSGGAQNAFENFSDVAFQLGNRLGSIVLPSITAGLGKLSSWAERATAARSSTLSWAIALGGTTALMGPAFFAMGQMTMAATALSGALKVGLLPLLGVGGAIILGLSALTAWFIKSKLAAGQFASAVVQAGNQIAGEAIGRATTSEKALSELATARKDLERTKTELATLGNAERSTRRTKRVGGRDGVDVEFSDKKAAQAVTDKTQKLLAQAHAVRQLEQHYLNLAAAESAGGTLPEDDEAKFDKKLTALQKVVASGRASAAQVQQLAKYQEMFAKAANDATLPIEKQAKALERAEESAKALRDQFSNIGTLPFFKSTGFKAGARAATTDSGDVLVNRGLDRKDGFYSGKMGGLITDPGTRTSSTTPATVPLGARLETAGSGILKNIGSAFKGIGSQLLSAFNPLTMISSILAGAFEKMAPTIDALQPAIDVIATILGAALAPILRGLFPILKMVAIGFTYVAQFAFNLAGGIAKVISWILKGVGMLIKGIGDFINWALPGNPANGIVKAGKALIGLGEGFDSASEGFIDAASAMPGAREEIRGINLDDVADSARKTSEALRNVPAGYKIALARFNATQGVTPSGAVPSVGSGAASGGNVTYQVNGPVTVVANDTRQMYDELGKEARRKAARGGTSDVDLGTRRIA